MLDPSAGAFVGAAFTAGALAGTAAALLALVSVVTGAASTEVVAMVIAGGTAMVSADLVLVSALASQLVGSTAATAMVTPTTEAMGMLPLGTTVAMATAMGGLTTATDTKASGITIRT